MKVLIVGYRGGTHIGGCLERAAFQLRLDVRLIEARLAMEAPVWLKRFNWWFLGRRPTWLKGFSKHVLELCKRWRPHYLVTTGIAPLETGVVRQMSSLGICKVNYLTDDPWNPAHRAPWFLKTLSLYEHIFTPRKQNLKALKNLGCRRVSYLPFGYAPELHFLEMPATSEGKAKFDCDVVFVGGADRDRVPYIAALIQAGFNVGLYGSYWERFAGMRPYTRGQADPQTLRRAISRAKVALCLVRRANRDGHCMRTFEIPAIGACMLTEDTEEHREIFGDEANAVVYFRTVPEMLKKLSWLLAHDDERRRLARAAHRLITDGPNTYKDRLATMIRASYSTMEST